MRTPWGIRIRYLHVLVYFRNTIVLYIWYLVYGYSLTLISSSVCQLRSDMGVRWVSCIMHYAYVIDLSLDTLSLGGVTPLRRMPKQKTHTVFIPENTPANNT